MTDLPPGTLTLRDAEQGEIAASHADLFITVQGTSWINGRAALAKAKEVAQLVTALEAVGVAEDRVFVENVQVAVSSGTVMRTSSAVYALRISLDSLDILGDALGVLILQKTAKLSRIAWRYPDTNTLREELLRRCLRRLRSRALVIAEELDSRLDGVHSADESVTTDPEASKAFDQEMMFARSRSKMESVDLGMEINHTRTVRVQMNVTYRLQPLDSKSPPDSTR